MYNYPLCSQQLQRRYYYLNTDYFAVETIIESPCSREIRRRRQEKERTQRKIRKPKKSKSSSQKGSLIDERRQIGRLKAKIDSYEGQLEALRRTNNNLRWQLHRIHSSSHERTPTYPGRHESSVGKIAVMDRLKPLSAKKISANSEKRTAEQMDQLLVATSRSHISQTSNEQSADNPQEQNDPRHKFTEPTLKVKQPCSQSGHQVARNEGVRVSGRIRQSRNLKQTLYSQVYYQ